MRTLAKLLVAGVIVFGAYRIGTAYWDHYALQDAMEKTARFSPKATDADIAARLQELAAARGIDIPVEGITVDRRTRQMVVSAAYTRPIEILPGYSRPWDFDLSVTVFFVTE